MKAQSRKSSGESPKVEGRPLTLFGTNLEVVKQAFTIYKYASIKKNSAEVRPLDEVILPDIKDMIQGYALLPENYDLLDTVKEHYQNKMAKQEDKHMRLRETLTNDIRNHGTLSDEQKDIRRRLTSMNKEQLDKERSFLLILLLDIGLLADCSPRVNPDMIIEDCIFKAIEQLISERRALRHLQPTGDYKEEIIEDEVDFSLKLN